MKSSDNIIAIATPPGAGAIAVIRLSGPEVIEITDKFFQPAKKGKNLSDAKGYTLHFGYLKDGEQIIDEVLVSVFRAPHSYTGENAVEISVHGSPYIQQKVLEWFLKNGVRMARPGEFTLRAFLHGKMDLTQAEAVADLIAAENEQAHQTAMHQLRGGFTKDLKMLRDKLIEFAALMELELDFAEEDVEFADRQAFQNLLIQIKEKLNRLIESYQAGNVIKHGVPVAIIGEPNTGKSTLLNALLNEEKAIVTDIPGTTRDVIEDTINIEGATFRFIDTAGLRKTRDEVEKIGIERTYEKVKDALIVLWLLDAGKVIHDPQALRNSLDEIKRLQKEYPDKHWMVLLNKTDKIPHEKKHGLEDIRNHIQQELQAEVITISAKQGLGLEELKKHLAKQIQTGVIRPGETVVTNLRHYQSLQKAYESILQVEEGLKSGLSTDLLTIDIRTALHHLGEITGEITTDDLLDHIFRNFCIGK